jgi:ribosome-binding protein aMBF1 (putative translation factor)
VSLKKAALERRLTMTNTNTVPAVPMETSYLRQPPQHPLRYLNPVVAQSIANAKTRTGLSWRRLSTLIGVSHPHLVLLAQGKRVPSLVTAERIISVLSMTLEQAEALRAVATEDRGKSRPK